MWTFCLFVVLFSRLIFCYSPPPPSLGSFFPFLQTPLHLLNKEFQTGVCSFDHCPHMLAVQGGVIHYCPITYVHCWDWSFQHSLNGMYFMWSSVLHQHISPVLLFCAWKCLLLMSVRIFSPEWCCVPIFCAMALFHPNLSAKEISGENMKENKKHA